MLFNTASTMLAADRGPGVKPRNEDMRPGKKTEGEDRRPEERFTDATKPGAVSTSPCQSLCIYIYICIYNIAYYKLVPERSHVQAWSCDCETFGKVQYVMK